MSIDPKDLKVGDRVLAEAVVYLPDSAGRVALQFGSGVEKSVAYVQPVKIHSILPRPLAAGDRVFFQANPKDSVRGDIKVVIAPYAWVEWNSGIETYQEVVALSALERA